MSLVVVQLLKFGQEMQICRWHYENEKGLAGLIWLYVLGLRRACLHVYTHLQHLQKFLWVNLINQKAFMTHIGLPILRENIDFPHLLHTLQSNLTHCNEVLACILKLCLQRNWVLVLEATNFAKAHILTGAPLDFVTTLKSPSRFLFVLIAQFVCVCRLSSNRWADFQLSFFVANQTTGMLTTHISAVHLEQILAKFPLCECCPFHLLNSHMSSSRLISGQSRWSSTKVCVCRRFLPIGTIFLCCCSFILALLGSFGFSFDCETCQCV